MSRLLQYLHVVAFFILLSLHRGLTRHALSAIPDRSSMPIEIGSPVHDMFRGIDHHGLSFLRGFPRPWWAMRL